MVILEEMAMYRDTPEDAIQDEFDELMFAGHSLGKNILGTQDTVSSFTQKDFYAFLDRNLNTSRIIMSSVGNYDVAKIEKIARKYLAEIPYKNHTKQRIPFDSNPVAKKVITRPISQVHVALGSIAYPLEDERRIPLFLLTNLLGGPYMNSKLNMALREKNGLVYGVEANYNAYCDTGLCSIFFATDPRHLKKSLRLTLKELGQFRAKPLSPTALNKAKQQIKGHLAMSEENNNALMMMLAKSLLDLGRVPDLNEIFRKIDNIHGAELQEIAIEIFPEHLNSLIFEPEE